jgi:hypothetical protein
MADFNVIIVDDEKVKVYYTIPVLSDSTVPGTRGILAFTHHG